MSESLGEQIRRVLKEAPFAMRQLAADAGLSYDVLRSWRSGRRRPSRSSAERLAAGLQQRGELLLTLAAELRATAGAADPPAESATAGQPRAADESPQPAALDGSRQPGSAGHGASPQQSATPPHSGTPQQSATAQQSGTSQRAGGNWPDQTRPAVPSDRPA